MANTKMNLATVISSTELTPVSSAKLNECKALTSNETAITAVEQFAKLDVFDSKYNIKRCEVLAYARKQLKDEPTLTFKKMCEVFGLDDSNAGKMATIWDMFYCEGEPYTLYSISQLSPFTSKRKDDVMKVFEQSAITPSLPVKTLRAIAGCIDSKHGITDNGKILDILNGDITTAEKKSDSKTNSKSDSKTNSKTDSKTDSKTKVNTMEIPVVKIGESIVVIDEDGTKRQFTLARKEDGEIILQFISGIDEDEELDGILDEDGDLDGILDEE